MNSVESDPMDDGRILEPRGLIAENILIPENATGEEDLVEAVVDFVNWAMDEARLVPGEIAQQAFWSYHSDYYLAQVNNGGHRQFAFNSGMSGQTIENCRCGLAAMSASDHLQVFEEFLAFLSAEPARLAALNEEVTSGGRFFRDSLAPLDHRFFALEDMKRIHAAWLRALPIMRPLPPDRLAAERDALMRRNSLRETRADLVRRRADAIFAKDPLHVAARATCARDGVAFQYVGVGQKAGPDSIAWTLATSGGPRTLVMRGDKAVLYAGTSLRSVHFFRDPASAPVPIGDGAARRALMEEKPRKIRETAQAAFTETSKEAMLGEFFAQPMNTFCDTLAGASSNARVAIYAPYLAENAKFLAHVPRAASPLFATRADYGLIRLIIADTLLDVALADEALPIAILERPDRGAAMLINIGAMAAAAAAGLRILDPERLAALSRIAPNDFLRERNNVEAQLFEIAHWWPNVVRNIADVLPGTGFTALPSLFSNVRLHHAKALGRQLAPTLGLLVEHLAPFWLDYPKPKVESMIEAYSKGVVAFASRFASSRAKAERWTAIVRVMRTRVARTKPPVSVGVSAFDPGRFGLESKEKLVGVVAVVDDGTAYRQGFRLLKDGERALLGGSAASKSA